MLTTTAESAIVARIGEDFNLTPVLAKAHYEQMARYFAEYGQVRAFKTSLDSETWINGGYFILTPRIFEYMRPGEELDWPSLEVAPAP